MKSTSKRSTICISIYPFPEFQTQTIRFAFRFSPPGKTPNGTQAVIDGTWISVFPTFFSNLAWATNDWKSEEYYYVNDGASCINIGSALAGEVSTANASEMYVISKGTLERLVSYYTEVGLMTTDGTSPFTEVAQKIARRHRIGGGTPLVLSAGEIRVNSFSRLMDDDIPF